MHKHGEGRKRRMIVDRKILSKQKAAIEEKENA